MFFRNFYPEKVPANRIPNIHLLVRCGIGDIYTFLTRIPSLQQKYPQSKIYIYVGGWDKIPFLIADVLAPYKNISGVFVLEGYYRRSLRRMKRMIRFLESKALPGDIIENWIPTDAPLAYPMNLPFTPSVYPEDTQFVEQFFQQHNLSPKNTVAIHPISTKGNADSFEYGRFWSSDKWQMMVDMILEKQYKILLLGAKGEEHNLNVDNKNIFNFQGTSIRQTIAALVNIKGILSTNSWTWEVAANYGLPAAVLWGVNHHHRPLHLPEGKPQPHTFFETDMNSDPTKLCNTFLNMLEKYSN